MSRNRLIYTESSLPASIFRHLIHLKILDLMECKKDSPTGRSTTLTWSGFETFTRTFPTSLKELHIDICSFPCTGFTVAALAELTDLTKLELYRRDECEIEIGGRTFEPMRKVPNLIHLMIRFDNLRFIEPYAFSWIRRLHNLDMSYTRGMSVADFYPVQFGLKEIQLKQLNLTSFKRNSLTTAPNLIRLNKTFFDQFDLPDLTLLVLDDTEIQSADEWKFHPNLPNLVYLSLTNNNMEIHTLQFRLTPNTQHLQHLMFLDVSFQKGMFTWRPVYSFTLSPEMNILYMESIHECFIFIFILLIFTNNHYNNE